MWFKYLLFAFTALGALLSLLEVRKGTYQREQSAFYSALVAVFNTLLAIGIWFLL